MLCNRSSAGLPAGRRLRRKADGTRVDGFNIYVGAHGKIILDQVCGITSKIKDAESDGRKNHEHGASAI